MLKKIQSQINFEVLKNSMIGLLGTFMIRAVNLISVPIFTRLLNTSEYGRVNIFMTYVSIFTILLGLDFHGTIAKGCLDYKTEKNEFFSVSLFFTSFFTLVILVIANIFGDFFPSIFKLSMWEINILLIYSYASFVISYKSVTYIFQLEYKKNLLLGTGSGILNLVFSVILIVSLYSNNRFEGRILGAAIPTILIAMILYVATLCRGKKLIDKEYISYACKIGIPLIPHNLSHMILTNADKIMISNMINDAASGVYGLVYNVGLMLSVLIEALNNVWNPWLFRKIEAGEKSQVKRYTKYYLLGFTAVTIVVMSISPEIIKIIAPEQYWEGIEIVNWVVYSVYLTFLYGLYVNIELYYKKTSLVSIGTMIAATSNILLNWLGLKSFGYEFAAISTVASYVVLVLLHMVIVSKKLKSSIIENKYIFSFGIITFGIMLCIQLILESFVIRLLYLCVMESLLTLVLVLWLKKARD